MNTNEQKRTPGPWAYTLAVAENSPEFFAIHRDIPLSARWGRPGIGEAYTEADARLIAAAPALAEALRSLQSAVDDYRSGQWQESPEGWEAVQSKARAALALIDDTPNR
jgi:hypothetical protein